VAVVLAGVGGCSDCDTKITTGALPDGFVGLAYNVGLTSDCGGDAWFLTQGNLPPGIGLLESGSLKGVPTLAGTYSFTIGVIDFGSGEQAYKGLSMTVLEVP
jgi:hypothetical protein